MKKKGFTLIEMLAYITGSILLTFVFINFIIFAFKFYNDEIRYSKQKVLTDNCIMYIRKIANETSRLVTSNNALIYKSKKGKDNVIHYDNKSKVLIDQMQDNRNHILLKDVEGFRVLEKENLIIITIKFNSGKERNLCVRKKEVIH